jgi:hypothetical protein
LTDALALQKKEQEVRDRVKRISLWLEDNDALQQAKKQAQQSAAAGKSEASLTKLGVDTISEDAPAKKEPPPPPVVNLIDLMDAPAAPSVLFHSARELSSASSTPRDWHDGHSCTARRGV